MATRHTQAPALAPWGVQQVDAGIVPLMEALWAFGVDKTRASCEDCDHAPGKVFVGIDSAQQMQRLLAVANDNDLQAQWEILGWTQPGDPTLILDVFIPHEQVDELTRRLAAATSTATPRPYCDVHDLDGVCPYCPQEVEG